MWIIKLNSAKNWGGIPNGKMGTSITQESFHPSVTSEELYFYNSTKDFEIWKDADSFHIWAETWDMKKTEGFASGLRRWVCFIQQSKPCLYTKRDRMCPDMLCVWLPLFITSNTSSAYSQYSGSSTMHLNSMIATGDLSPGATASDLLSSCILSHLGAHH